jgi:DNA-binding transcriptional LysR family regulator
MDRLTSLTVFARVVESGGFSAAARRLNMSATMVSNHVQALEDRLGARLLNRTTRKISLTEIGRTYYERCAHILAELDEADRAAGALHSMPRGTLRVHTNTHLVRFLAPVVSEFLRRYPEVTIDLSMGERMVDLVEERFDLAIRSTLPPDSSLIVRQLAPWRQILCCSPAYLATHSPPRTVADLARHNCLRYAFYPFGDEWRFVGPSGEPVSVRVTGNLLTQSAETLRFVALAGQGVFLAPSFIAGEDVAEGRLVRLLEEYRPVEFVMNAIYPHGHHLAAKVRGFIDLVSERFAEHRKRLDANTAHDGNGARQG